MSHSRTKETKLHFVRNRFPSELNSRDGFIYFTIEILSDRQTADRKLRNRIQDSFENKKFPVE